MVPDCLSRYTHRVSVCNERIVGIDAKGVRLRVRADDQVGKRNVVIHGATVIGCFLQQALPTGFKRIRNDGLFSTALKTERLAMARAALNIPAANPQAREEAVAFLQRVAGIDTTQCWHFPCGRWLTTEVLLPQRGTDTDPHPRTVAQCRGPP